ncbi:hypothetical protein V6N13_039934 [Hibiscus sabdariffa]|uniref:Uncharacterized protein n=1 Tax=Hibiscus sabdariffa TaxID=183260 RepID=A0ABR1ZUL3_9ROSI
MEPNPNNMGHKNNHSTNDKWQSADIEGENFPPIINVNVGTIQKDQHNTSKSVLEGFVDIPITFELESPRNSIGSSEPTTHLLEKDIGSLESDPSISRIQGLYLSTL